MILNIIGKELLVLYPLRTELSDLVVAVVVDCYKLLCGSHPRQPELDEEIKKLKQVGILLPRKHS